MIASHLIYFKTGILKWKCHSNMRPVWLLVWSPRFRNMSRTYFLELERKIYSKLFFLLVPVVIIFGPLLGIVTATFVYGIHTEQGALTGMQLRHVATWVRPYTACPWACISPYLWPMTRTQDLRHLHDLPLIIDCSDLATTFSVNIVSIKGTHYLSS